MLIKKEITITSTGKPTLDFKVEGEEPKEIIDETYKTLRDELLKEYMILKAQLN